MKVLQLINVMIRGGGAEKVVFDHTMELHRIGIEVEVLSLGNPVADDGEFISLLREKGITVNHLNGNSLYSPLLLFRFLNYMSRHHYDVVHVHLYPSLYYAAISRRMMSSNTRIIYTEHSTSNKRRGHWLMKHLDAFFYPQYDAVACISVAVRDALRRHVAGLKQMPVIPNGIDIGLFRDALSLNPADVVPSYREGDFLLLMNARFVPAKDHTTLLSSMRYLPENVHLLLLGAGPLESEYRNYCVQNHLQDRVHFLGIRKDVPSLLATANLIVHSSHYEGFSVSMLEAMASGKPFVASAVPGIKDLVEGVAWLVEPQNDKALAEAILHLLNDNHAAATVIERCRNFVENYSISVVSGMYLSLYRQFL